MNKGNEPSSALAAGRRLIELRERDASDAEWRRARADLASGLRSAASAGEILALLDEDRLDDLPVAEKTAAFERLLELGAGAPEVLRRFAQHLWFHGPESDDRAAELNAAADRLEAEGGRSADG